MPLIRINPRTFRFAPPPAARPGLPARVRVTRPPPALRLSVTGSAVGLYRAADPTLERYELYRGVDASPDLSGSPWATFASLPNTTAALTPGHTYRFVLRRRNRWDLLSRNVGETVVRVAANGSESPAPPSDPSDVLVEAAAAGTVRVRAEYAYLADGDDAADLFIVYVRSNGTNPDPATDTPVEVDAVRADGVAKLDYTTTAYAEGATVKVIVRTRRSGSPDVDSTGSTVHTATATLLGPAAPTPADAFVGDAARQVQ